MDIESLIAELSRPEAYPHPVDAVEVRQTHISVVFLAGDFVYKLHKPVRLGFLDFSTAQMRHADCEAEVRLNRRLAPEVYLGVVFVEMHAGHLRFVESSQRPIESAVKMRRLPDRASLLELLNREQLSVEHVTRLGRVLADFHSHAEGGPAIAEFGRLAVVGRNAIENFDQSEPEVGVTVVRPVFDRVRRLTEAKLAELGPLIESRADRGIPRDTHGDLHLDHVYLLPDRSPPDDLVIIDCIEFNDRFRFADPVADLAFAVMDLKFRGRRDLARVLTDAYFAAAGDVEGRRLVQFYTAYRAVVRAKVEGMTLREPEVPVATRGRNRESAIAHWLLALGELESPERRPTLILIGGLPGTGKSTIARALTDESTIVIRSDEVRKELFGADIAGEIGTGAYSPEARGRVYAECLARADAALLAGHRVIVDANFREETDRARFRSLGRSRAVPVRLIICEVDPAMARARLRRRSGDASDADERVYQWAAEQWQPVDPSWADDWRVADTTDGVDPLIPRVKTWLSIDHSASEM